MRKNNHLSLTPDNLITNIYDFTGKVWLSKMTHVSGATTVSVVNRYEYDAVGRVLNVYQKNNNDAEINVVKYTYNALGQLVDKKLHNTGSTAVQSVDYRYNIRGWLRSINNGTLTVDAANNDDSNDFFGIELLYNQTETGLNNDAGDKLNWNGNVSVIKWKGIGEDAGTKGQRGYKFAYDRADRSASAVFREASALGWNTALNALNEQLTYDHNGNIATLQRNDRQYILNGLNASYTSHQIDDLGYTLAGNRLDRVDENAIDTVGFVNGNKTGNDYAYDNAGNLTKDLNKGIQAIQYNVLGKPQVVQFAGGGSIQYTYDAAGNKLTMTAASDTLTTTTQYADGFVYVNGALQFFGSPEGRVVATPSGLEYQYAISDHQGNTRVVFTSVAPVPDDPVATFEGDAGDEESAYLNIDAGNVVSFIGANHTSSGSKVLRANQNNSVPAARSLKVYPGDKVDMEVWAYYESSSGWGNPSGLSALITNVAGVFGGVSGAPGESGIIYNAVDGAYGLATGLPQTSDVPEARLNYILFDKNYNWLDMGWKTIGATSMNQQQLTFPTINIRQEGYIFVYLTYENESNNWVYFDDFKVTHTKTRVLQYNEYYPFGLQTSNSWSRSEAVSNSYLYNAASELNNVAGIYETPYRGYDAALGRFLQVDPLATVVAGYSPYAYANNNPILFNDPLGLLSDWGEVWKVIQDLFDHQYGGEWHSDGSGGGGSSYYGSDLVAFYAGARYADANNLWGQGGTASNFETAAQNFSNISGQGIPLREATIFAYKNPYGDDLLFNGEPYWDSYNWLHIRINEKFIDYGDWLRKQTDELQQTLDISGSADPTGVLDGINALIYVGRGDMANAAISAVAIVPYIGDGAKGLRLLTAGSKALHKHHVLPQTFKAWFKSRGITNIDDFTVLISQSTHLKGVHGKGLGNLPGQWNSLWADFISTNPNASSSEIFHFAEGLLSRFGLEHLPYTKY